MPDPKIEGGYILWARKVLESGIMEKPPLWLKLFMWMVLRANRTDGYPGDITGEPLGIGMFETTATEMQAAMTHYVGYRKEEPTPKQIRVIYEGISAMKSRGKAEGKAEGKANGKVKMIEVEPLKGKRGLRITILNYKKYQNPKNYEGQSKKQPPKQDDGRSEKFTKSSCRAILYNKNQEYKKNKKYIYPDMIDFVVGFIFDIQEEKPKFAPSLTKTHLEDSYKTIIDLIRLDGFDWEYIKAVIWWAQSDVDFWADNLQSLATLRKKSKSNGLKKFQNIARSYDRQKTKGGMNGKAKNFTGSDTRKSVIPERLPDYSKSA